MSLEVTFFVVLFLSIIILFTIPLLRKWFKPIEIFILFMFTSYNCQNMFYTISSPYDRISVVAEHFPSWTVQPIHL
jgi:glucan phosphoethanolaminetransferase (alkaline phosphatase superfamily)